MTQWTRWELVALGLATVNGQQQRASCFPTLLRNDLNLSDVVYFTTHDSNLSCNKSGFCQMCTAWGYWLTIGQNNTEVTPNTGVTSQNEFALRVGKRTYSFCFQKVKSWALYFLQQPDLLQTRFADLWVAKRTTFLVQNELHVLVAHFTVPLSIMKLETFLESRQLES